MAADDLPRPTSGFVLTHRHHAVYEQWTCQGGVPRRRRRIEAPSCAAACETRTAT